MTRTGSEPGYAKPGNDIYTAMVGVALVAVILGLIVVYLRAETAFGGLLKAPPSPPRMSR